MPEEPAVGDGGYARSGENFDWEDVRIVMGYNNGKPISRLYVNGELKSVRRITIETSLDE